MRQSGDLAAAGSVRWPLIGRREELAAVEQALTSVGSRAVVLAGAPGVGKTRLALEALGRFEAREYVVRWAVATRAASSIPFGAVAHLLPRLGDAVPDRAELLQRAVDGLVASAGNRRTALKIEISRSIGSLIKNSDSTLQCEMPDQKAQSDNALQES